MFHPIFTRLQNLDETPSRHDLHLTSSGALIRARVSRSNSRLYVQRVASAGSNSSFTQWTYLNRAYPDSGVALCGSGSYVLMVYVHYSNRREIRYRESDDDGVTWSSDSRLVYPSIGGVSHLTAAMSPAGKVALFFAGHKQQPLRHAAARRGLGPPPRLLAPVFLRQADLRHRLRLRRRLERGRLRHNLHRLPPACGP